MFCLYHFSGKCIIKIDYLPPYGPLKIQSCAITIKAGEIVGGGRHPIDLRLLICNGI